MAVDRDGRLSYVEVLPDVKEIECCRVLSDNASAFKSHGWRKAAHAMGLKVKKTRPYTRRTNGKAERFIKTFQEEWAYVMPCSTSAARNQLLQAYLRIHNGLRCHMVLGGLTLQQRPSQLLV